MTATTMTTTTTTMTNHVQRRAALHLYRRHWGSNLPIYACYNHLLSGRAGRLGKI